MSMAIFNIEINEQCPLLLDLITTPRGNFWTSEQAARKLQKDAKVKINVLVLHKEGLFSRTDNVKLSDKLITYETIKEADKPINTCAVNNPQLNAVSNGVFKNSETKVIINKKPSNRIFKPHDLIFEEVFESPQLPNWNRENFLHSNAIGDRSEDFTAVRDEDPFISVSRGTLLITPSISMEKNTNNFKLDG